MRPQHKLSQNIPTMHFLEGNDDGIQNNFPLAYDVLVSPKSVIRVFKRPSNEKTSRIDAAEVRSVISNAKTAFGEVVDFPVLLVQSLARLGAGVAVLSRRSIDA